MNFTKDNLVRDGDYVFFVPEGSHRYADDARFVARFKYASKTSIGPFMTHLRKFWTVEAYFEARETLAPLEVVEKTGFVLSHVKKVLRDRGYPQTPEGFANMIRDRIAA